MNRVAQFACLFTVSTLFLALGSVADAQVVTTYYPPAATIGYVPVQRGLFGQRTTFKPVVAYAPATTVTSYAPAAIVTGYAPAPVTVANYPLAYAPATTTAYYAAAAPVTTTYYAPAPVTTYYVSPAYYAAPAPVYVAPITTYFIAP